jgi:hypothetical protein
MSRRNPLFTALLVVSLVVPAGAAQRRLAPAKAPAKPAASAARAERPVPFKPGETLTYDVSWSNYLTAGEATVSVREKRGTPGSSAYYIVAEGKPTPLLSKLYTLYYKADTLLDAQTLLPQRGSIYSDEGGRRRTKVTQFNQGARTAAYHVQTATLVRKDVALAPSTQDALSVVYVLRALALKPGSRIVIPVTDSGITYRVTLSVGGTEPVQTGAGTVTAWKITPSVVDARGRPTTTRQMAIWISDDARRLPVKMMADAAVGSFIITLREAKAGR